jgi:hypothetical protein
LIGREIWWRRRRRSGRDMRSRIVDWKRDMVEEEEEEWKRYAFSGCLLKEAP